MFELIDQDKKRIICFVAGFLGVFVLYKIKKILPPFLIGFFVALAMEESRDAISRRLHVSKKISSAVIVFVTFTSLLAILIFLVPLFLKKLIFILNMISYDDINQITSTINARVDKVFSGEISIAIKKELVGYMYSHIQLKDSFAKIMKDAILHLTTSFSMIIIPITSYITLLEIKKVRTLFYITFFSKKYRTQATRFFNSTFKKIKDYFRTQLIISGLLSFLYSTPLCIMGIKSGLMIGVAVSCLSFIPYIGFYIGLSMSCLITFENYENVRTVLQVCGILVLCQVVDSALLSPKIIGDKLGINPFWLMLGTLASIELFGAMGVLIGIPIVIFVQSGLVFVAKKNLLSAAGQH